MHCLRGVILALLKIVQGAVTNLVDLACGQVVFPGQTDVKETFIIAQVQINLQQTGCECMYCSWPEIGKQS